MKAHHPLPFLFLLFALLTVACGERSAPLTSPAPASAPAAEGAQPIYVEPNESVGAFSAGLRTGDVPWHFGPYNVRSGRVYGLSEDAEYYIIDENTPAELLILRIDDDEIFPRTVRIRRADSRYRMRDPAIRVGMSLAEVRDLVGEELLLYGVDPTRATQVYETEGGRLTGMSLHFAPAEPTRTNLPTYFGEDNRYRSSDSAIQQLALEVAAIDYYVENGATADGYDPRADVAIVPRRRVGPIDRTTTVRDLRAIYGADQTQKIADYGLPGGAEATAYRVLPGTADELLFLPGGQEHVAHNTVVISRPGGRWRLAGTDIGVGATVAELESANGGPFRIMTQQMESAGEVANWYGGRLTDAGVRLDDVGELADVRPQDHFTIDSNQAAVRAADLRVAEITVYTGGW